MAAATRRDWRFNDDLAGQPRSIPANWLDKGEHEPVGPGQVRTFAVLFRVGVDLEYDLHDGEIYEGPHRERPALEVLYATVDGEQAHVRILRAERTDDGVRPREFTALAAADRDDLRDVAEACRPLYMALVGALCGDPVSAQRVLTAWRNDGLAGVEEVSPRV